MTFLRSLCCKRSQFFKGRTNAREKCWIDLVLTPVQRPSFLIVRPSPIWQSTRIEPQESAKCDGNPIFAFSFPSLV